MIGIETLKTGMQSVCAIGAAALQGGVVRVYEIDRKLGLGRAEAAIPVLPLEYTRQILYLLAGPQLAEQAGQQG